VDLDGLTSATRVWLDDTVEPYLYAETDVTRRLNNAVREAALRARLMRHDADTDPKRCSITVPASAAGVAKFDPSIIAIRSGSISTAAHKLWAVASGDMDDYECGWDAGRGETGDPCYMVMDLEQKMLRLWPTPTEDLTLRLRVWRVPVEDEQMVAGADEPVIQIPDAEELAHWACYECFLTKDADTYDPTAAASHLAQFEARFGRRPSTHEMARWGDAPPRRRRGNFF
jgi:hypothetical protein